jgi:hypothetical protein
MSIKIPAELRAAMSEVYRSLGKKGGKTAARNMTAEQRKTRAKKASEAAARKRTAERLARERTRRPTGR